jgi:hypothetical protein
MMVSEHTARRVADALERLIVLLERLPATAPPQPDFTGFGTRCGMCGGFHGSGVICPALKPTAGGTLG